ncbi:hypothetical protein LIT25_12055 [Bacillus sp. F19]|nr:hypothetical protein LIT25_12055 [Bacillus sp. F19]
MSFDVIIIGTGTGNCIEKGIVQENGALIEEYRQKIIKLFYKKVCL